MALFVPDRAPPPDAAQKALHFVPPSARERRAQAIHRLQVGLFGLAGMLLLVGLANIIMDRARIGDMSGSSVAAVNGGPSPAASALDAPSGSDPLADIGVVPDLPPESATPTPAARRVAPQQGR